MPENLHELYSFEAVEHGSLRQEILIRILIQNFILIATIATFGCALIIVILVRQQAALVALAYCLASGASALAWCHNGIRQAQIKSYLLLVEARNAPSGGWETWLPRNRIGGWLGTRWFISTKGVFIGSQIIVSAMSLLEAGIAGPAVCAALTLTTTATAGILLINPKEHLPAEQEGDF